MDRRGIMFLAVLSGVFLSVAPAFSGGSIATKVLVRVVSKDSKVIGSGVGGPAVRIVDARTGETLARGLQEGGTGDTDRIMVQPRLRGKIVYGTPGAAFFLAENGLERPTQVEIRVEAPLGFSQALQRGSKTITLIPGKDIGGEGVVIELDGLIVDIINPAPTSALRNGDALRVKADVRML